MSNEIMYDGNPEMRQPTSPAEEFIQTFYNLSYYDQHGLYLSEGHSLWLWAFTIAIFCIGGSLGALGSTYISDVYGRRGALLMTCAIAVLASVLMGISQLINVYQLVIAGRFIIGVAGGIVLVTTPLYLSEISPVRFRGGVAAIHQLGVSLGILVAQLLGLYPLYTQELWPILLAMTGVFSLIGCSVLVCCPESPRWYLIRSSTTQHVGESEALLQDNENRYRARESLKRLRATGDVEVEIAEMLYERRQELSASRVGILDVITLKDPMWKWPLIISIVLHSSQQLAGINAVMYYTTELFIQASLSKEVVKVATCGTGLVIVITDVITIFFVDKLGRRFFLLLSYSVMAAATVFLTVSMTANGDVWPYLSIVSVYIFLFGFSPGPGAMTMVIVPEI
ncbi:solute carrier family 2, facilitated glucose transporter member 1-like isoform X2 [Anneissia japonica]|uniref:solute carrier family 2, facilitated glucose transporter member 1-like isoform X2 n=1 Tax=Anneissia japonica TaxID=1529436 RepID=UPI001425B56C|nr:solute carrier family 2, facilitated glucose transporter member 1-like isoform X2 [Anneissia japonica]